MSNQHKITKKLLTEKLKRLSYMLESLEDYINELADEIDELEN